MPGTNAQIRGGKLLIQNTLFVAKNGDDTTALPNRWDKPYLTVDAATIASVAGDTVYVFPGIFNEGTKDITKSNVKLFLELGSVIECDSTVINDFGVAKNIIVDGYGDLRVTDLNFSVGVIQTTNAASNILVRCNDIIGVANGVGIFACASFDITVRDVTAPQQYAATFRGNIGGSFKFRNLDSASGGPLIFRSLGTDLVQREIYISGNLCTSQVNSFGSGVLTFIATNNTKIIISDVHLDHSVGTSGGLMLCWSGFNFLKNVTGYSEIGYGIRTSQATNCVIQIEGCGIVAQDVALHQANVNSKVTAMDSTFVANNQTGDGAASQWGAIQLQGAAELDLDNCTVVQESALGAAPIIRVTGNGLRMRSCKLVGDDEVPESITSALPQNVCIELQCVTNKPTNANITNLIPGTSVIVNANVQRNSDNYFKN